MNTYWITDTHPQCDGWAIVNDEFELKACNKTRDEAARLAQATATARGREYGGVWREGTPPIMLDDHDGLDI
jgi:hypothetical protein